MPESTIVPSYPVGFRCEFTPSKVRVHALVRHWSGAETVAAVLTVTDAETGTAVARTLTQALAAPLSAEVRRAVNRLATELAAAPRASFLQAVADLRAGRWPATQPPVAEPGNAGSTEPDYEELFPLPSCSHDDEDDEEECEQCDRMILSPRNAAVLASALTTIADESILDIQSHGDRAVDDTDTWMVFDALPRVTWELGGSWRARFAQAARFLAADLKAGHAPLPACTAEEMALLLAFKETEVILDLTRDDKEYEHQLLGGLPTHQTDYEWVSLEEVFLQDTDVLMVFRADPSGEALVPEDDILAPSQWFTTFLNMPTRCLNSAHDRDADEED